MHHRFPRLGTALLRAASRDEAVVVEHLVNIGRRSGIERTAHFFMELTERLSLVGRATETEFKCPLTQTVLGDALGLSAIHVNEYCGSCANDGCSLSKRELSLSVT
jgi:CRP-like cAMP-binding protein